MKEVRKEDYYAAQIAAEIRQFREMFAKTPKSINIKDCLIDFGKEPETKLKDTEQTIESLPESKQDKIEMGPDALQDPKWSKVNKIAKATWAGRFGVKSVEEFAKPTPEQIEEFRKITETINQQEKEREDQFEKERGDSRD